MLLNLCLLGHIFFSFLVYGTPTCNETHVQAMTYKQHRVQHVVTASRCPRQIYDPLLTAAHMPFRNPRWWRHTVMLATTVTLVASPNTSRFARAARYKVKNISLIVLCAKKSVSPQQKLDTVSESQKHSLREVTESKMDPYSRGVNKLARSEVLTIVTMNIDVLWNIWTFIYPDDESTGFICNVGALFTTICFRWQYLHYQTVLSYVTHFRDHTNEDGERSYSPIRYMSMAYIILPERERSIWRIYA